MCLRNGKGDDMSFQILTFLNLKSITVNTFTQTTLFCQNTILFYWSSYKHFDAIGKNYFKSKKQVQISFLFAPLEFRK